MDYRLAADCTPAVDYILVAGCMLAEYLAECSAASARSGDAIVPAGVSYPGSSVPPGSFAASARSGGAVVPAGVSCPGSSVRPESFSASARSGDAIAPVAGSCPEFSASHPGSAESAAEK